MSELADFQQAQLNLAKIIRTGEGRIDNVEPRRLKVYQELFFNNVDGFCSTAFPVLKSLFSEDSWKKLVHEFFVKHECETPHFVEIAQEFLSFLAENKQDDLPYPFMLELAHYEWVELASSIAHGQFELSANDSDFEQQTFALPESSFPLLYQFPVHAISEDNADEVEPEQTALLVYRDEELDVQFVLTDILSVVALQVIQQQHGVSSSDLVELMHQQAPHLEKSDLINHLQQAIHHFVEIGAVQAI